MGDLDDAEAEERKYGDNESESRKAARARARKAATNSLEASRTQHARAMADKEVAKTELAAAQRMLEEAIQNREKEVNHREVVRTRGQELLDQAKEDKREEDLAAVRTAGKAAGRKELSPGQGSQDHPDRPSQKPPEVRRPEPA